jgi:CHAD domain-containing protein
VKPQRVDLGGAETPEAIARRIVHVRWDEARALAGGLQSQEMSGLHQFRIAGKRLRYALERFEDDDPSLRDGAELLKRLQDALGETHDRDVLLTILPPAMVATQRRLRAERERYLDEAVALWNAAEQWLQRVLIVFE